jgi:predicted GNAT superfamily acetyltransferase
MDDPIAIRRAEREDLSAAARLLAETLRFSNGDAIPPWLMRTTEECGGVTLVASAGERVVGVSYAMPALGDGAPVLFSCGLAVDPARRGHGVALDLKLAQRREALALGYRLIRWTTDPVNGRALRVYLTRLGARIVGYRAGLHDGLRADPGHPQDDLDIVWHLVGSAPLDVSDTRAVELPWSAAQPDDRRRVREEMSALLADGFVGHDCELERDRRRCRLLFAREGA